MPDREIEEYLQTSREWIAFDTIESAENEAKEMEKQYYLFLSLKQKSTQEHQKWFDNECISARRSMMDANSFLVSIRRKGYLFALQDINIKRTTIDEDYPEKEIIIGEETKKIDIQTKLETTVSNSKWSTMFSR
ncbi:MAG: hypothetical protein AABY22_26210 [Nanoarchaeota archaeon]